MGLMPLRKKRAQQADPCSIDQMAAKDEEVSAIYQEAETAQVSIRKEIDALLNGSPSS